MFLLSWQTAELFQSVRSIGKFGVTFAQAVVDRFA
jgi:hypothetical protein